jgi:hypothetical protein
MGPQNDIFFFFLFENDVLKAMERKRTNITVGLAISQKRSLKILHWLQVLNSIYLTKEE